MEEYLNLESKELLEEMKDKKNGNSRKIERKKRKEKHKRRKG
jgi:cytoskeletal protein RodZ